MASEADDSTGTEGWRARICALAANADADEEDEEEDMA